MLRGDLADAGITYALEGPDGPEYADFHSLRHSYLTLGGRAGIDLRTLQELAGHSDPILTARYSHRRLYDLAGAVDKLPNLVPNNSPNTDAKAFPLRSTGTDPTSGVVTGDTEPHLTASNCNLRIVNASGSENDNRQELQGNDTVSHRSASRRTSAPCRARTDDPLIKSQLLYQLS